MLACAHQSHRQSHTAPNVAAPFFRGKQIGACSVRVLLIGIVKIEHCAPQLAIVFLGNLAKIVAHAHFVEKFLCLPHNAAQRTCISLGKH